jgi:phosphoribosylformylglycinamidine cyclo-ligase
MPTKHLDYHQSVNYEIADPAKVLAQKEGKATAQNMPFGFSEVEGTRGESAYVFDMGAMYGALVQEGLGTKSLIAQEVYKTTNQSFFAAIAQDTVATVINDLVSVGATPVVLNAYWSASSYAWLADKQLTTDFITGWRQACDMAHVTWGGGETQSLPGVVEKDALEFAGCGFGVVKPKRQLMQDSKLQAGDAILLLGSSGIHANGVSMAREIANILPKRYQTKLADGTLYGEALLTPTTLYGGFLRELFDRSIDIHYVANITGHGWRKLMRGSPSFSYILDTIPSPQPIFDFIQHYSGNSLEDMYSAYNMGAGYALYLPEKAAIKAQTIAKELHIQAWIAGHVEAGPKRVVIEPHTIIFNSDSLRVR